MINTCYSHYQLNAEQFDNLFTDNVNIKNLDLLGKSAADGNRDSIDMLHNIALRHDDIGKKAENILFNLFSGKTPGRIGVDEEIKMTTLRLYETADNVKDRNNDDMRKLCSPSKLLYMAGSAMINASQKQDVSAIFSRGDVSQTQHEQFDHVDLWSNNRMLVTDEIDAALNGLITQADKFSVNFPVGLIDPVSKSNILSELIVEKARCNTLLDKTEIFPINTGEHWILFVLCKNQTDGSPQCIVFNSLGELNENTRNFLMDSARLAGVTEASIEFINGDMQRNVPNGCGVFVVKAAEMLSNASENSAIEVLHDFLTEFSTLSEEEQTLFNIQCRRQLFEHSIVNLQR